MNELKLKVDDQIKSNLLFFVRNFVNKTSKKKNEKSIRKHIKVISTLKLSIFA